MEKLTTRVSSLRAVSILMTISAWTASASSVYDTAVPEERVSITGAILSSLGYVFYLVMVTVALFITWRWLRLAYVTAERLEPVGIGYRKGWTFWGWIVPIVSLWFPKRIIEACYGIFQKYLKRQEDLEFGFWWATFIGSGITGWLSFRFYSIGEETTSTVLDVISSALFTLSLPGWLKVVGRISEAHDECLSQEVSNQNPDTSRA